jgi:putative peptide zinc metalloprotease protein
MAEKSQFSQSWYRVADLRPTLKSHIAVHRHQFRGDIWYVLQDHASGRYHRFSPAAYALIGLMDGRRTVAAIWRQAAQRLGRDLPTQDEVIQLLAQLHHGDALDSGVPPDVLEVADRAHKHRRRAILQKFQNPMAVRIPLLDPDRFLNATAFLVRPLFGIVGLMAWLAIVVWAVVMAASHWDQLTENVVDRVLSAHNIALMLIAYPVIKALHELGHGYAVKRWGGEVHEMGIMFLVLMPVPYVEASTSAAFPSKWQRALVGAAGIMVEVLIAALALAVWLHAEPGLVRTMAFNAMLIAGVSTVLFNGNPLLRFDGYYVLADLVEIPNLGTRSNRHLLYLIQRYLFGAKDAESPATAPGERSWFVCYGLAALAYRLFIMTVIVLFIASKFFVIGVILALWAMFMMLVLPLAKGAWFVLANPRLEPVRGRALAVTVAFFMGVSAALGYVPLPYATMAEGVLWVPERGVVHAAADGTVQRIVAMPNTWVEPGDLLIELEDPLIETELRVAEARIAELRLRLAAVDLVDQVEAARLRERIGQLDRELVRLRERAAGLELRSRAAGRFVLPSAFDLPGRFVHKGELLGYVVDHSLPVVRVLVPETDIGQIHQQTRRIDVRFAGQLDTILPAVVRSETPAATRELPSAVLSTLGGGRIPIEPGGAQEIKSIEIVFQIDLGLDRLDGEPAIGSRAYVRFDHGNEPAVFRLHKMLRQLFLSTFRV